MLIIGPDVQFQSTKVWEKDFFPESAQADSDIVEQLGSFFYG